MCRRHHGAAFSTFARVGLRRLHVTDDGGRLTRYASSAQVTRSFCARCGSSLFWSSSERPRRIWIAAGTLDGDPDVRPEAHIFVSSHAPWYEITDHLTQHDEAEP